MSKGIVLTKEERKIADRRYDKDEFKKKISDCEYEIDSHENCIRLYERAEKLEDTKIPVNEVLAHSVMKRLTETIVHENESKDWEGIEEKLNEDLKKVEETRMLLKKEGSVKEEELWHRTFALGSAPETI